MVETIKAQQITNRTSVRRNDAQLKNISWFHNILNNN